MKNDLKVVFDLESIFSWPKYGNAPAAASRAVMVCDMAFGVQFNSKKMMGSMSNESSNSALQDAHTHYWVQIPYQ